MVTLRPATIEDARLLFDWRNDEETRRNSINQEPVEWDGHVAWLERSLLSPARKLYIAQQDGMPVGTVRADLQEDGSYELSWTVAPEARGKGIGKTMVMQFVAEVLPDAALLATIQEGNTASEKIAAALGLSKKEASPDHKGFVIFSRAQD